MVNPEFMVAIRRARMIRRSAWAPQRDPLLPQAKAAAGHHVEPAPATKRQDEITRRNTVTGLADKNGRLDALVADWQAITEKIYFGGRGRPRG
ncbi:hypothetical protein [Mycobacterium sp. 1164985.4]|uniref:hypothetical protein n=1 Tax=Mycobacterium sp. 1164985.4 TaxID=1834069 RepID=UPI0007FEDE56|nr:hypothetical protein [Mycobacterium sp. 1164985.4]OBK73699.1 hypothetical protein A5650_20055 [Mycobacterium sp. 1164985.4]